MEDSKKAFSNWRMGAVHLRFPNGNWISTTWASGSYSDNYGSNRSWSGQFVRMESDTCEIMVECPDKLHRKIWKKYGEGTDNSVLGYLNIKQWAEIVTILSK